MQFDFSLVLVLVDGMFHVSWRVVVLLLTYSDVNKQFSYRRETALQGGLVIARSGRLELEDNIYGHYRFIFIHCDVFGQQRNQNRRKKQNKGYYAVQGHRGRYQSKARMRLPISD